MNNYLHIKINLTNKSDSGILIAGLDVCGFEGFLEEDNYLNAFIREESFDEECFQKIIVDNGVAYTKEFIKERNWNEEWEKSFEPVIINNFCAIRASFHKPIKTVMHEIVITPKMSFGTGHHATTYLMVETISKIDCKGKSVLDFGTGTGVLSILMEKCGAKEIVAIDNDDWSIENTKENIITNDCFKIKVQKADSIEDTGRFDIILANINKNTILECFPHFRQHLSSSGVLILSGLLSYDYTDIELSANHAGFQEISKSEKDNWISIVLKVA